ncbi:MAG: hypothetical protein HYX27_20405 [Acidobacteria bacterium]|nr:hypothetical protein [Acidobacteriota bacterium]
MLMRLIAFCFLTVTALLAQSDTIPPLLPAEKDIVRESIRRARATRFNVRVPFSMIEPAPGRTHPFVKVLHEEQPELPYQAADTIMIGDIVDLQPFLSSDGKGLYTEYSVSITTVLKSGTFPVPIVGDLATIFREGGIARLPNGKVAKHNILNDITPRRHQTCLFFLTSESELEGFSYRNFWLIENGLMRPAYPEDLALGSRSTIAGRPASDIIALLAAQIKK